VQCERDGVRGRLRAALDRDVEAIVRGLEEEVGDASPLLDGEQNPLARGPEREDPVEPCVDVEVDERAERVLVDGVAVLAQRRHGGGQRTLEHMRTLGFLA
jgi:hypothetical protein